LAGAADPAGTGLRRPDRESRSVLARVVGTIQSRVALVGPINVTSDPDFFISSGSAMAPLDN
jgi:hypothetical protein